MTPSDIESMTLKELRATRRSMFSAQWTLAFQGADDETKAEAGKQMLAVNHAIVVMENKELSEIRDQLVANEADLVAGTQSVSAAFDKIGDVKGALSAITGLLGTVGKVVAL